MVRAGGWPLVAATVALASPDMLRVAALVGAGLASFLGQWWMVNTTERANRLRLELDELQRLCDERRAELARSDKLSVSDGQKD